MHRPELFLYIFLLVYLWFSAYISYAPIPFFQLDGVNIYLGDAFFAIFVFLSIMHVFKKEKMKRQRLGLNGAIMVYCIWLLICILRGAPEWGHSAFGEARFAMWVFLYFPIIQIIDTRDKMNRLLRNFMYIVLSYVILRVPYRYFVQFDKDLYMMLQSKQVGWDISLLLGFIFIFLYSLYLSGLIDRKRKAFVVSTMLFCVTIIMLSARTGILALVVATAFIIIINMRKMAELIKPSFLIISALLVGIAIYVNPLSVNVEVDPEILKTYSAIPRTGFDAIFLPSSTWYTGTVGWRLKGWANLFDQSLTNNPVFGEGFGAYYNIYGIEYEGVPPHNDWLIIFSKMGLIGLAMFILIVYRFYRIGFMYIRLSKDKMNQAYMKAFLGIFLAGLVAGTFFFFIPFMWVAAGLQTTLVNITKSDLSGGAEMKGADGQ